MSYLFFMDRCKKEFLEQTDKNIESPVDYYFIFQLYVKSQTRRYFYVKGNHCGDF